MSYSAKTDAAFLTLHQGILDGTHAPGEPLRVQPLAARYGISATPLREALSRLEEKRLVVGSANRGWRVAPVSLDELEDLETARLMIESSLLEDAMARGDLDWESAIVAAHHRLSQVAPPLGAAEAAVRRTWIDAHDAFHLALLSAARSSWLRFFYVQTCEQLQRHHQALLFHPRTINPEGPPHHSAQTQDLLREALSIPRHTALMQVVLGRDRAAALAALRDHVEITLTVYRSIVGAVPGRGAPGHSRQGAETE